MMMVLGRLNALTGTSTVRTDATAGGVAARAHTDLMAPVGDSSKASWCDGVDYCVSCYIYPSASRPTYQVQLTANVSVLLAAYNNRNNLD